MKKQTAVEWLDSNLIHAPHSQEDFTYNYETFERAKQMEKDQIIDSVNYGTEKFGDVAEQYYEETYGS
jgi:hypothetical protein